MFSCYSFLDAGPLRTTYPGSFACVSLSEAFALINERVTIIWRFVQSGRGRMPLCIEKKFLIPRNIGTRASTKARSRSTPTEVKRQRFHAVHNQWPESPKGDKFLDVGLVQLGTRQTNDLSFCRHIFLEPYLGSPPSQKRGNDHHPKPDTQYDKHNKNSSSGVLSSLQRGSNS